MVLILLVPEIVAQCGSDTIVWNASIFDYSNNQSVITFENNTAIGLNESIAEASTSSATKVYTGYACFFNLNFFAVGENTGRTEFKIYVNTNLIATFTTALSANEFELSDKFIYQYEALELQNGDIIKIESSNKKHQETWSRAAWHKLELIPAECSGGGAFVEENGYVVIEMESQTNIPPMWQLKNGDGALGSYLEYTGSNSFGSPQGGSKMQYKVYINNPGTYQFLWRTRNGFDAEASDAENDSWLKINADNFYGIKSGENVDCNGDYIKVWVHNMNSWTYNSVKGEHHGVNGFDIYATFNTPGEYTIDIGGRSNGHIIDRMILFLSHKKSIATSLSTPESKVGCSGKFTGIVNSDTILAQKGPFPGVNHVIPGLIDARMFDIGDEGITHHDFNEGWEGGLKYSSNPRYEYAGVEDVEIEEEFVAYIRHEEWITYTISNTESGVYDILLNVASISPSTINVYLDTVFLGSREIPNTRSWTNFRKFDIKDIELKDVAENAKLKIEFIESDNSHTYLLSFKNIEFVRTDNASNRLSSLKNVSIYPNPVKDVLILELEQANVNLQIYNLQGVLLHQEHMLTKYATIQMDHFKRGVYVIRCKYPNGITRHQKIIIE